MSTRVLWYWNRLRCMTPAEVARRARDAVRLHWSARFAAAPRSAPQADTAAQGRPWFAGDVADLGGLRAAADEIVHGRLQVLGLGVVPMGVSPQWRRCPKTGVVAPLHYGPGMALGDRALVGDIKHLWEPSRHHALVVLAQAWHATRDVRYLDTLGHWLQSWIEQNPHPLGPHWASALECGIRLINWSIVWRLTGAALPGSLLEGRHPGLVDRWREAVYWHLSFVRSHLSAHSSANNHLVGELAGLYVGLCTWPCWEALRGWRADVRQRLQQEALKQNAPDGVNREQASAYQQFVLEFVLIAACCAEAHGESFEPAVGERLRAMCRFLAALVDAGGHLPQIGDADDGLACGAWSDAPDNALSLLAAGAVLFDEPAFARAAGRLDAKTVWLLGRERCARFEDLRRLEVVLSLPQLFGEGGYAVLGAHPGRDDEVRIVFDVGPLGYLGIAAHGHADALSVLLSVGGEPMLVDPGTYSYHGPLEWREHFRSTRAHNTLELDGRSQSVSGGRFMWVVHANARCTGFAQEGAVQRCSGRLERYAGVSGLAHQRSLCYDTQAQVLEVLDEVQGSGSHGVALHWQVAPGVQVLRSAGGGFRLLGRRCEVLMEPPAGWKAELIEAREGVPQGWVSSAYERKQPARVLRVAHAAARPPLKLLTRMTIRRLTHPSRQP
ncbi:MAG: alginate lyase family protein [Pseudomonadota bacterium]